MLRLRSLSIKLSVSLFRADKIDLFANCILANSLCHVNVYPQILYAEFNRSDIAFRKKFFQAERSEKAYLDLTDNDIRRRYQHFSPIENMK